jgi:hypothetical protein
MEPLHCLFVPGLSRIPDYMRTMRRRPLPTSEPRDAPCSVATGPIDSMAP